MIDLYAAGFDDRDPRWQKQLSLTTTCAVAFIVSGQTNYRIDGALFKLRKGDLLFIPAGCLREAFHDGENYHQKYWVTFAAPASAEAVYPLLTGQRPRQLRTSQFEYMKQRFALLVQQWMGKLPYCEPICEAIVAELLGHMSRELDLERHPMPKSSIVAEAQAYILARYRDPIRVDELAKLAGCSPNYLSALFRQLTGNTVKHYIHQVKLSAARDLLLHADVSIGQAAEYVGFCDQAYFNRVFKKIHGFPPSVLLKERSRVV
ncbi:MAG: helix-turn-helix transcriptional regulator [Paenibacillaceae bacterium]|nr:helix-turn-helix transcriptional regulator [Paenibacillaceae bacterium]